MDERIRIILEVNDKASKVLKSVEDRLKRLQGSQAQGQGQGQVGGGWRLSNRARAELEKQANAYERIQKAQAAVPPGIKKIESSLKPMSLQSMQAANGLRKASTNYQELNRALERGATVNKKAGLDQVGMAIEKLGEYAGISTQRVAGMVARISTFASTLKTLNAADDGKGGGSLGDVGEMGSIQRVLMSIAAAFGLVSTRSKGATKDASKFASTGTSSIGRFMKALRVVTAVRVGLVFKNLISGSQNASAAHQRASKVMQGAWTAYKTVQKGVISGTFNLIKANEQFARGTYQMGTAMRQYSTSLNASSIAMGHMFRTGKEFFGLFKGATTNPLGTFIKALSGIPRGLDNVGKVTRTSINAVAHMFQSVQRSANMAKGMGNVIVGIGEVATGVGKTATAVFRASVPIAKSAAAASRELFASFTKGFQRGQGVAKATAAFKASENAAKGATSQTNRFVSAINSIGKALSKSGVGAGLGGLQGLFPKGGALIDLDKLFKPVDQKTLLSRVFGRQPVKQQTLLDKVFGRQPVKQQTLLDKVFGRQPVKQQTLLDGMFKSISQSISTFSQKSQAAWNQVKGGYKTIKLGISAFRTYRKVTGDAASAVGKFGKAYDSLAGKMFRGKGSTAGMGLGMLNFGDSKKALVDLNSVFDRFKKTTSGFGSWLKGFNADIQKQAAVTETAAKSTGLLSRGIAAFRGASFATQVAIAGVATAVIGLTVAFGKLVHMAFTRGREHFKAIESATLQYKFLYGSASQAEERIQELTDYAARTPFQLKGIVQANRLLLVFGGKALATQDMLSLIGDAAAVSGQQFERVAFWIGRMYTLLKGGGPIGEATRALTEMGVIGGDLQNELNKMATSGAGLEATFGKLTEHMKKSQGATAEMAETLAGLETTLSDTMDLSLAKWFEALEGDKLEKWFKKNLIGIWNTIGGLAEFVKAVKGAAGSAVDFTVYMVDSERAIRGFVAGLDDQTEAVERATDGYKQMVESTDELKDFWKVAAPAGVATSAKKAMEEFEAADKKRQEAADRREKKEEEARKAAEEAAKAREEEAKKAAEAHELMFKNLTMFSNETKKFGGELSAVFLPFGELPQHLAVAQASASEFFLSWKQGIESSPTIGNLTLTGGPGANAGLEDIPDTWKKASEEASKGINLIRNAFELLAKTGDSMASRMFAAGAIVVDAVQGIMNAASKGDVFGALLAAGSALLNVFKDFGKTAQELIDTLDAFNSALDEVRSGSLTAAEAIDKATNWQGNEEGFEFMRSAISDFEAIGRTATEATAMVGAYWQAMREGDQGAMERIGTELIHVAEQARIAREEAERLAAEEQARVEALNALYDSVVDVYLRAKEAGEESYKGIMAAADEYQKAVTEGDERKQKELIENHGEWVTSHATAQDHALAKQEEAAAKIMAKEREKHVFMAALEAALAEIRAGNAAGAAEAAENAANQASQAWDTAMKAVGQADQVATDAIKGNATGTANHIVSETDTTTNHVLSAEDQKKKKILETIAELEREYLELGGLVRTESTGMSGSVIKDTQSIESKWQATVNSMGGAMAREADNISVYWRNTMREIVNEAEDMAHEVQGGSIWPDMIAGMVQETDLLLPAVEETMETVRGFIENAETAAREEALLTRIERIKAIEDVAEREKEWRELQLDLAKDWLSKEEEIAKEEERIRDQQLAKEEERLKEQQRLHEEQLAKEEQAARDRAFMADDVRSAARAFGIDSSQLGVEFHAQQAREKAQKWAEQIALLQKGGLSDKQLAQNDVVRSRMARMLEDIDKYGLTLPEHLKGLAQEVGFARGSGGIRDFGDGTPTMLHNREAVVTERSWLRAIESAARGGGGGSEFHVVDMKWNGITLGRMNLRYGPKALHLEGVR